MRYRFLCLLCLMLWGCFDLSNSVDNSIKLVPATSHGSDLIVLLAAHCQHDMACRSSVLVRGTPLLPRNGRNSVYYGFHYTFIGGNDTIVAEDGRFVDGNDTTHSWSVPVTDGHVRFSLLDKKKKRKDYDIDLSPWLGKVVQMRDSVAFTNFEVGSEVYVYKIREKFYLKSIFDGNEKVLIPNDSSFYPFFKVRQIDFPIEVGEYTDKLSIMTTVYWR